MTVRASTAATPPGARAVLLAMLAALVAFQLTDAVASLDLMPGEPQPDAEPRRVRRAPGRSLQHLQGTTGSLVDCPAGSAVTHTSDGACVDCLAGTYASGRTAVCIFPDMPLSSDPNVACSTKFNPTEFASKYSAVLDPVYGANAALNTMAAQCDFGEDAAALISGDEGYCSFADIGFTHCVPSASIDADGGWRSRWRANSATRTLNSFSSAPNSASRRAPGSSACGRGRRRTAPRVPPDHCATRRPRRTPNRAHTGTNAPTAGR